MRAFVIQLRISLLIAALWSTVVHSESGLSAVPATLRGGDGNVVFQLFGYVKDSVVRTVDGTKEMWSNHGRCKEIRAKQKVFRDNVRKQWELQEKDLSKQEMQRRLSKINGGITYDEFVFLAKGKEDRSKLMTLLFISYGAPKLFPYVFMFYPEMLPSPFAPLPDASGRENKLEKLSRQRAHTVIRTLCSFEKEAKSIPALGKLNIFGRKKQQQEMIRTENLGRTAGIMMTSPGATGGAGAQMLLDHLNPVLYKKEEFTRAEKRLVNVPKSIVSGLMAAISGPAPLNGIMPNFMRRGNVCVHIQKVTDADNFLVEEKVDLDTLSTARLLEACNDRLIAGSGRSDQELRQDLKEWLEVAVVKPTDRIKETGENFNEVLARSSLMGFYAVQATCDPTCSSYLPRLMFQGQAKQSSSQ